MKIWCESYDAARHLNPMGWSGPELPGSPEPGSSWQAAMVAGHPVLFVQVCGFTFEFHDRDQVRACLEYYSRSVLPSRRLPVYRENHGGDHYETQRWFDRLPHYLRETPKRLKVRKALAHVVADWERLCERPRST